MIMKPDSHRLGTKAFLFLLTLTLLCYSSRLHAWNIHALFSYPVLSSIPEIKSARPVKVKNLRSFLIAEEKNLEAFLAEEEIWARKHLNYYRPLPDALAFKATGNHKDILQRFFHAIRINPGTKAKSYLQLIPGRKAGNKKRLKPENLTFLQDREFLKNTVFVKLQEGEQVSPLDVITGATDEPDYGMDVGLYENNKTSSGKMYNFGIQPFGNPNLEHGSQPPFHMGFYHEAWIVFFMGDFLTETYPEYRIHLFKKLSEFAFKANQDYWGWRFLGWGLHYVGDLTQPYHSSALPGVNTLETLWINFLSIIGFPDSAKNAIQLVSNRHVAIEYFGQSILERVYIEHNTEHPLLRTLKTKQKYLIYNDSFPREIIAKAAYERAEALDAIIEECIPAKYVSDPEFELGNSEARQNIVAIVREQKGEAAVKKLTNTIGELLELYSIYTHSYVMDVLGRVRK